MSELKIIKPTIIDPVKNFEKSRPLKKMDTGCDSREDRLPMKTDYSSLENMFPIVVPVDSIAPPPEDPPVKVKALSEMPAGDKKDPGESEDLSDEDALQHTQDDDGDKEAVSETQRLPDEATEAEPPSDLKEEDLPAPDPAEDSASLNSAADQITGDSEGFQLNGLAVAGNNNAAETALAFFQKAAGDHPPDNIAQAYYASCLAITGRDSTDSKVVFENTLMGLTLLNRSVSRDPDNHKIRILRAYLLFSLPENLLHLSHKGIKDFLYLITEYERDGGIFSESFYHQMLYDLGVAYDRAGKKKKALKTWKKLLQEDPDPMYQNLLSGKEVTKNK